MMREPAKVLEVACHPPPHGGWAVRVKHVKERLVASGHECVVLNLGESRRIPSPQYETVESGRVYLRKLWRYVRRGYLVHSHANGESPKGFALALIAELAGLLGSGSVLTFHAGVDQVYFPRAKAPWAAPFFKFLFWLPRAIICNSGAVKAKIVEYGVPPAKVHAIPAFSRQYLEFDTSTLPEYVETFYRAHSSVVFCYLAMRPVYFPDVLIEAFASVAESSPDVGLLMCGVTGHGDDDVSLKANALIAEKGLASRICVVGDFGHDQFLTALTRSAFYVRTHLSDGVCSSILEALGLGVPVVACENGNRPPEVITYHPADARALAGHMQRLLEEGLRDRHVSERPQVPDTVMTEVTLLADSSTAGRRRDDRGILAQKL